jgi:glycosyltransferase involved in cell wall biosynthesis
MGLHVLILSEADLGSLGGGESVIHGLVRGLAALDRGDDRFTILCPPRMAEDLRPWLGAGMQVLSRPAAPASPGSLVRSALGPLRRPLGKLARAVLGQPDQAMPSAPPPLDPFVHALGADLLHFMMPLQYATGGVKTVFTVHDLQHEHLPEVFPPSQIAFRRKLYSAVAQQCQALVAISQFTALDFQQHHPHPPEKLFTVPWASYLEPAPTHAALPPDEQTLLDSLPQDFILYPAFSYRHKNHRRLLETLSLLEREHHLRIPLVCTGGRSDEWPLIRAHHQSLTPQPALFDLGYTSRALLLALYRQARFVVFPTLFEGAGLPLLEAARLERPIACSDIPPFREFGGAGPAFFDPRQASSMAAVLRTFWTDAPARAQSVARTTAYQATHQLTWERCARSYLAIYRHTAGAALSADDRQILADCRAALPQTTTPETRFS